MARPELVPGPQPEELPTPEADASISFEPRSPMHSESHSESPSGSSAALPARTPGGLLVAGLVIALVVTGLALLDQSRRAAALSGEVEALKSEVAVAASAVEAYEMRFEQVRGEVGALVSSAEALRSLVTPKVVPGASSGDPAPAATDSE